MFPVEGSLATNINWSNSFGRKAVPFVVSNCSMTSLLKYPLPSESKTLNAYQNSNHKFIGEEKEKEKEKKRKWKRNWNEQCDGEKWWKYAQK